MGVGHTQGLGDEALEEPRRWVKSDVAVDRLAGGVAHDMNNILAAVLSYAELLADTLADDDPRRRDTDEIRCAALRGAALMRQLLAFSGRQRMQARRVDVNEVVSRADGALRAVIGSSIRLELRLAPNLPHVRVDPAQIEQVLLSLAENSRDAMPLGGELRVATELERGRIVLRVTDTGSGMDAATLEHLFEPFFTTKAGYGSTGLGLSAVLGIVGQSQGDIDVASEPGRGTTFRITLPPYGDTSAVPRGSTLPGGRPPRQKAVLLVEGDPTLRASLARSLRGRGYRVLAAASGDEGNAAAERDAGEIDLLVVGGFLADATGADVSERIHARRPALKVLFIGRRAERPAHGSGPAVDSPWLEKPFAPEVFLATVRAMLGGAA